MLAVKGTRLQRSDTQAQSLSRAHMWACDGWCGLEYENGGWDFTGAVLWGGGPRLFSSAVVNLVYL